MIFRLVLLEQFSGPETAIYSVVFEGESKPLLEQFVEENIESYPAEVRSIISTLKAIGDSIGAREDRFKIHEGKPGDGVSALYDKPNGKLRLFCIRYGKSLIIVGSGGIKEVAAWQDDKRLKVEAEKMIEISRVITESIKDQYSDVFFSIDGKTLEGNLEFKIAY